MEICSSDAQFLSHFMMILCLEHLHFRIDIMKELYTMLVQDVSRYVKHRTTASSYIVCPAFSGGRRIGLSFVSVNVKGLSISSVTDWFCVSRQKSRLLKLETIEKAVQMTAIFNLVVADVFLQTLFQIIRFGRISATSFQSRVWTTSALDQLDAVVVHLKL